MIYNLLLLPKKKVLIFVKSYYFRHFLYIRLSSIRNYELMKMDLSLNIPFLARNIEKLLGLTCQFCIVKEA